MYENLTDVELMVYVMWLEARGEGPDGMRGAGHVIHNRVGAPGFPKTLRGVLLQPNAFSCLLPSDPEFGKEPDAGDSQFAFCEEIAPKILGGSDPDLTHGAHYYANLAEVTSGWFGRVIAGPEGNGTYEHPQTATIGRQRFYA